MPISCDNTYIPISCNNPLYRFSFWNKLFFMCESYCFLSKIFSLHALFWYHLFKTLLSLGKEVKSYLISCGWTNVVYEFMRSIKKLRVQEDGNLENGDETRYGWSYSTFLFHWTIDITHKHGCCRILWIITLTSLTNYILIT